MILFDRAGIIGLGLIGGSLARAMKKHGMVRHISGYSKSPESAGKALKSGMIDEILPINQMAGTCDIIIICAPLGVYEDIAREIGGAIKGRSCIITDVGSAKSSVADIFIKNFPDGNHKYIVPAHPIAGTEKTGVDSGFAELFEKKKLILTPLKVTSTETINSVSRMWQACGSDVEILDAGVHDRIYAEVSHLPQFLAYCYAGLLRKNSGILDIKILKNNKQFMCFTRICASDPVIWQDIFTMNKKNLLQALDNFITSLPHENDGAGDGQSIIRLLPAVISSTLVKCSPDAGKYAGSGFRDFTSYSESGGSFLGACNVNEFVEMARMLAGFIRDSDTKNSIGFMQGAAGWYGASLR